MTDDYIKNDSVDGENLDDVEVVDEENPELENEEQYDVPELKVSDLLFYTISMLVEQAWVKMGVRANPATNTITKDLDEARLSIDSVEALVKVLSPKVEENVKTELKNIVSTLQMNFVTQSAKE